MIRCGKVEVKVIDKENDITYSFDNIKEFSIIEENQENYNFDLMKDFMYNYSIINKIEMKIKRVKKKTFVKMLMSKGFQRNEANCIALFLFRKFGYYNLNFLKIFN